ncbi:hypothetical protein QYF36_026619 [Acer negundo]|nr:hypothetical protein QYF36_026619 [Acer negundo]
MGFVDLFMFAVKYFDILAWSLLALVYPLKASIRAIEADDSSSSDYKNLPFWLYLKLVITCWLVIPNFDGAFKEIYKREWTEALEKLVAIKLLGSEPNEKTVRVAEQINEEVSASEQVKFVPHFLQEISLTGLDINPTENKKPDTDLTVSDKAEAVGESFEPEQVQKEWTCAICLLTVENETILNSHLQSKRHKAACEEIKIKTQQSKNKASTAPDIKFECREPNVVQKEVKTVQVAEKIKEVSASEQVKFVPSLTGNDINQTEKFVPSHLLQKVSLTGHDISQSEKFVPPHLRKVSVTGPDISQTEKFVPPHLLQKVSLTGNDMDKFVPELPQKVSPTKHDISQAEKFVPLKLPQKVSLTGHDISQKGKYVPRHLRKVSVTGPDSSQTEKFVPPHLLQMVSLTGNDTEKFVPKLPQKVSPTKHDITSETQKFVPHFFLEKVSLMGQYISQTENKKPDTDLMLSEKVEAVGACFEIPVPKQVQKEWSCAICQLTTQCETTLNSHLHGKRHKAACEAHNKEPAIQKPAPEVKLYTYPLQVYT